MRVSYEFDGQTFSKELKEIEVQGILLHATPDSNVEGIKTNGLKVNMPMTKALININAIFCTVPSETPNTGDLFRYYDNWSIVIIDTKLIPNHKWYVDIFGEIDASNNGKNKHVMTFEDIPATAIKIVKP